MNIQVVQANRDQKAVLRQLLELYIYDFTAYIDVDVNDHGCFEYNYLDHYWTEPGRYPYLVTVNGRYAGFALIREGAPGQFIVSEFFIMKKYRKQKIGKYVAHHLFAARPGKWEVNEIEANLPAQAFWRKIIDEYTNGNFQEIRKAHGKGPVQKFDSPATDIG